MQVVNVLYMLLTSNNLPNSAMQKRQSLIDKEQATHSYYSRHELKSLNTCKRVCDSRQQGNIAKRLH